MFRVYKNLPYVGLLLMIIMNLALYFTFSIKNYNTLADEFLRSTLFSSDALYLPSLYKDIVVQGMTYDNWYLTPAPYFFPDIFIYFLSNFITQNYFYAIPLFFTIELLLLFFILYKIFNIFLDKIISSYLTLLILIIIHLSKLEIYLLQYVSGFHYGEFLMGLYFMYLVLKIISNKELSLVKYLLLFLIGLLTFTSDRLFLLHFILPISIALTIMYMLKIICLKKFITLLITMLFIYIFGKILYFLLIPHEIIYPKVLNPPLKLAAIPKNYQILKDILLSYANIGLSEMVLIGVSIIGSFIFIIKIFIDKFKNREISNSLYIFLSLIIILQFLGTLAAILTTTNEVSIRHMIPTFIIPFIIPFIFIFKYFSSRFIINIKYGFPSMLLIMLIILIVQDIKKVKNKKFHQRYSDSLVDCLDNFIDKTGNIKYGVSQYWQVKKLYMTSKHNIIMAQVHGNLKPYLWITTKSWYRDKYDFAIIDHRERYGWYRLDKEKIIKINGEPDKIATYEDKEILYYNKGLKIE